MAKLRHYAADAPKSLSEVLLYEIDPRYSREHGEMAPLAEKLPMGAVLGQNGEGQYVPFGAELSSAAEAAAESEGGQAREGEAAVMADKPCAVLISRGLEASDEAQDCAVIRRGACVAAAGLFWLGSIGEEQKKTALAQLASAGIVPKE